MTKDRNYNLFNKHTGRSNKKQGDLEIPSHAQKKIIDYRPLKYLCIHDLAYLQYCGILKLYKEKNKKYIEFHYPVEIIISDRNSPDGMKKINIGEEYVSKKLKYTITKKGLTIHLSLFNKVTF